MSDGYWGDVGNIFKVPALVPQPATRQLMCIEEVLVLPSWGARGELTAGEVMLTRDISASYYRRIIEQFQRDHINRFPVYVAPASTMRDYPGWADPALTRSWRLAFGGGHHRLRMAAELGWDRILVTDSIFDHQLGIKDLRQANGYLSPEPDSAS